MFFMKPAIKLSQDERDAVILAIASAKDAKLRKLNGKKFSVACREETQNTFRLIQKVESL